MTRTNTLSKHHWLLFALPCLLMLATRMEHFGSAVRLPDASLAAFFFAGFLLRENWRISAFPVLCILAVVIDYWAITMRGVSSFCVTPAYGFLLPTYFTLWWAGRYSAQLSLSHLAGWLKLALAAGLAVSLAFAISNGSFYLFSGYITAPNVIDYMAGVARYYPRYAFYGISYIALSMVLWTVFWPLTSRRLVDHG
ncbi:MAG: hypothetical protein M0R02_16290 [Bacteroidales bacterium]|nr:hypothetical protein [Bacteroidales bacterium]